MLEDAGSEVRCLTAGRRRAHSPIDIYRKAAVIRRKRDQLQGALELRMRPAGQEFLLMFQVSFDVPIYRIRRFRLYALTPS